MFGMHDLLGKEGRFLLRDGRPHEKDDRFPSREGRLLRKVDRFLPRDVHLHEGNDPFPFPNGSLVLEMRRFFWLPGAR